jgi:hypothetical protein
MVSERCITGKVNVGGVLYVLGQHASSKQVLYVYMMILYRPLRLAVN